MFHRTQKDLATTLRDVDALLELHKLVSRKLETLEQIREDILAMRFENVQKEAYKMAVSILRAAANVQSRQEYEAELLKKATELQEE